MHAMKLVADSLQANRQQRSTRGTRPPQTTAGAAPSHITVVRLQGHQGCSPLLAPGLQGCCLLMLGALCVSSGGVRSMRAA